MKIGVIVDNDLNNDIRVLREIKTLTEQQHEIFVLCFAFGNKSYNDIPGISVTRIKIKRAVKNTLFFFSNLSPFYEKMWSDSVRKFIKQTSVEALHVHDLYMSKAAHLGIEKAGVKIPMVLDLHENYPFTIKTYNWTKGFFRHLIAQPEKWEKKEKEYLLYADKIITLSGVYRDLLISRYPQLSAANFAVVPNVPDLSQVNLYDKLPIKNPFNNDDPILFYYGVIAERRGVFDALEVFTAMVKESVRLNFLLIGPIDKKDRARFFNMISVEEITGRLHYIPWIDFSLFWSWVEICDICIAPLHKNPQHESGVANKVFDYMLGKKPVIVSDCAPQKKLVEDYKCGLVFTDLPGMKEAIKKLALEPQLGKTMGENGYSAILNDYNVSVFKVNLLRLYELKL